MAGKHAQQFPGAGAHECQRRTSLPNDGREAPARANDGVHLKEVEGNCRQTPYPADDRDGFATPCATVPLADACGRFLFAGDLDGGVDA